MHHSELRQDPVSGDWIVIAPGRAKKYIVKKQKRLKAPVKTCPFENSQASGNAEPVLLYEGEKDWTLQVIPNRNPAFSPKNICPKTFRNGPYSTIEGVGRHDIIITRDHDKDFQNLSSLDANLVFKAFKERYKILMEDNCSTYISIFHNWGPKAGASIYHPHYQMISIPVVPPDVQHSISGSSAYFKKNKKCVHCEMVKWEKKIKRRIIFENKGAIVFTPFVSREPFELRIFPKKHLPFFEETLENDLKFIVEALQKALAKIEKKLGDPDYNFFIHTAPVLGKKNHKYYHWHIEIQPKISVSAGFELGTGIEITVADPDKAARILR